MINTLKRFLISPFARSAVTLQTGSMAAVAVQAVAGILLARWLGPEQFGLYALAFSVAMVASVLLGTGAYDAMIPHISRAWHARTSTKSQAPPYSGESATGQANDKQALNHNNETGNDEGGDILGMLGYLVKFVVIAGLIAVVVGSFLPVITRSAYGDARIGTYAFVILSAAAVSTTFFELAKLSSQVTGRIGTLSALTFGDMLSRFSWAIGLVLAGLGVVGAITGHLFGALMLAIISAGVLQRISASTPVQHRSRHGAGKSQAPPNSTGGATGQANDKQYLNSNDQVGNGPGTTHSAAWPGLREIMRSARTAPLRPYLSDTLWVLGDRNFALLFLALPVALTGLFVPTEQVAFFKVAFGYVTLALAVQGPISILLNVRFPKLQVSEPDNLKREFVRITRYSVMLSAAVTVIVLALAPFLFPLLYGPQYAEAVPLAQAFAVHGIFFGVGVGLGSMWRALSKVKVSILINIITLGIGVPLGLYMLGRWGVWGSVAMVTLWYLISHVASYVYLVRVLQNNKWQAPNSK